MYVGSHAEWNLGSPGGWAYQSMVQQLAREAWKSVGVKLDIDFKHELLDPVPGFVRLLRRFAESKVGRAVPSEGGEPHIVLTAEEDTLDSVLENKWIVEHLNGRPGLSASLAAPHELKLEGGTVMLRGRPVSAVFQDFNNRTVHELEKAGEAEGLLAAVRQGRVMNPRGLEPLGAKGVFEFVNGDDRVSRTTRRRTPWTRVFARRRTVGPDGAPIEDLVRWTVENRMRVVLKPAHGYSGKGVRVGPLCDGAWDGDVRDALEAKNYIVQDLIPLSLWAEELPFVDGAAKSVVLVKRQTDFRCFIGDEGLLGFVGRFGGIPTNVGSGGGMQALAVLKSGLPVGEAYDLIHRRFKELGFDRVDGLRREMAEEAKRLGMVYLGRPTPVALRPRLLTPEHVDALKIYAANLWKDLVRLEKLWRAGELEDFVQLPEDEKRIAQLEAWEGGPALAATDGLYGFAG